MSESSLHTPASGIQSQFGNMDIYLFDQLQRGRIHEWMSILDAGCGRGRNCHYFIKAGFDLKAIDSDSKAIAVVRELAADIAPKFPTENITVATLESMEFEDAVFDVVICNAVLHFSRDELQFWEILNNIWRVLSPNGLLFVRLASSIGIEDRIQLVKGRRYTLPDSSERYLVDEEMLIKATRRLRGTLLDPLKTTVVQNQRAMTTWILRKDPN